MIAHDSTFAAYMFPQEMITTVQELCKIYLRMDQPNSALERYNTALQVCAFVALHSDCCAHKELGGVQLCAFVNLHCIIEPAKKQLGCRCDPVFVHGGGRGRGAERKGNTLFNTGRQATQGGVDNSCSSEPAQFTCLRE